jgi:hypothetical protein
MCGTNPTRLERERAQAHQIGESKFNSDIDIKILFSKVDSLEKKPLWTYNKNKTRHKWFVFKENQL